MSISTATAAAAMPATTTSLPPGAGAPAPNPFDQLSEMLAKLQESLSKLNFGPKLPGPIKPVPAPLPSPTPVKVTSMQQLEGRSIRQIAEGIINLYDQDGDRRISAAEATRVQRQHDYGFLDYGYGPENGLAAADAGSPGDLNELDTFMHKAPPYYGPTRVDVYAMTKLLFAADANHNGKVGVAELARHLRTFDKGDSWNGAVLDKFGRKPVVNRTAGDHRLTGSEFWSFMKTSGEQHVAGWTERNDWYYNRPIPVEPPVVHDGPFVTGPLAQGLQELHALPAPAAEAASQDASTDQD